MPATVEEKCAICGKAPAPRMIGNHVLCTSAACRDASREQQFGKPREIRYLKPIRMDAGGGY
jgi:hypothetical protein